MAPSSKRNIRKPQAQFQSRNKYALTKKKIPRSAKKLEKGDSKCENNNNNNDYPVKTKESDIAASPTKLSRPTEEECRYVTESLAQLHPHIVDRNDEIRRQVMLQSCGMRESITDAIISTMLSQNTTDANSKAAWKQLKKTFPDWEDVIQCDDIKKIEDAIRVAGLSKVRASRIQNLLRTVKKDRGEASLEYIREMNNDEVKSELSKFKGLGPKTISCVLLFALGRDEFPVDTHVSRITQKMGWLPTKVSKSRELAYEYLNEMVPNDVKMDLHCLLVHHGKVCHSCASRGKPQFPPKDGSILPCPLGKVSSWRGKLPIEILKSFQVYKDMKAIKKESDTESFKGKCYRNALKNDEENIPDNVKSGTVLVQAQMLAQQKIKSEFVPDKIKS